MDLLLFWIIPVKKVTMDKNVTVRATEGACHHIKSL